MIQQRVPSMSERALIELVFQAANTELSSNDSVRASVRRVAGNDLELYLKDAYADWGF
jgi:hypothetical protein